VACAVALARFGEAGEAPKSEASTQPEQQNAAMRRAALRKHELPEHS